MSKPNAIAVREVRLEDHADIARLLGQLGYEATPKLIRRKLESLFASSFGKVLLGTAQHELVGSISLHVLPLFHTAACLWRVTSIVVDERFRGRGVGSALMREAGSHERR